MLKLENGFTVIEAILGIALFGFVMPVVILAVVNLGDLNDRGADLTRANVQAEAKLEALRSAGYNSLSTLGTPIDFSSELNTSLGDPKSASYTVTQPVTGVKRVDITISYTEKTINRTNTYTSIISELGVAQ